MPRPPNGNTGVVMGTKIAKMSIISRKQIKGGGQMAYGNLTCKDLKRIRQHMAFTMKDFANLFNINVNSYKKMETGERSLSNVLLDGLSDLINFEENLDNKLEGKIDYLRLRFKTLDYKTIIDKLLKMDNKPFTKQEKGRYAYTSYAKFGDINIYYSDTDSHMGTLVEFSGAGCRQFEWYMSQEQGRDWQLFLKDCLAYAEACTSSREEAEDFLKVTRIDIALDELYSSKGNYDISKLKWKHDRGLLKSKAETFRYVDGASGKDSKGKSLYFGSRKSPILLNFYEKDLEQADKLDLPLDYIHRQYRFKNRYEVRLLDKYANSFIQEWLFSYEPFTLADKAVSLINDKLQVYKQSKSGLTLDPEWYKLMGSYGAFSFDMHPEQYEIGVKEYRWIERSVARTLKYLLEIEKVRGKKRLSQLIQEAVLTDEQMDNLEFLKSQSLVI